MNPTTRQYSLLALASALLISAATAFAQAPAAPAAGGGGGGGGGGGRGGGGTPGTPGLALPVPAGGRVTGAIQPNTLSDLETTEITRAELSIPMALSQAITAARAAVVQASLAAPANPANLAAKVQALAEAELKLAVAKADAYVVIQKNTANLSAEKKAAIRSTLAGTGGGRGGRAGGGGAAAGAAGGGAAGGAAAGAPGAARGGG